jgi:L-aminopeptidase/D-esterase-like protein
LITAVPGIRVGHWTDSSARTGCTVVLLPAGTVASGEVRGGAPGTREWALLDPRRLVDRVNAIVMSGGSAFGLAACDGVMRWCEERGVGWPTAAGPVPIVVGMVIYDLAVGDPAVRPGPAEGYAACEAARPDEVQTGPIGAGAGATIAKWRGPEHMRAGGLGSAQAHDGDLIVTALMVVNAIGDPPDPAEGPRIPRVASPVENTTIGVIVTNAKLDKTGCRLVAESGHDGLARSLDPIHAPADGDAIVVAATGSVEAPLLTVRQLASWVVERAVAAAVQPR